MMYDRLDERLGKRVTRKLQNNTYLQRRENGDIAILLHLTDVVTFKRDGRIILDSGGWLTVTTKDRMNTYTPYPIHVFSDRGQWFVADNWAYNKESVRFEYHDGIEIRVLDDNTLIVDGFTMPDPNAQTEENKKLRDEVDKEIKRYVKLLPEAIAQWQEEIRTTGTIKTTGDPWCCSQVAVDGTHPLRCHPLIDHWRQHFKDKYVFPTLVIEAANYKQDNNRIGIWIQMGFVRGITDYVTAFLRAELFPAGFASKGYRGPTPDRKWELEHPEPEDTSPKLSAIVTVCTDVSDAHFSGEEVPDVVCHPQTGEEMCTTRYVSLDGWGRGYWTVDPLPGWQKVGEGCNVGDWDDAPPGMSDTESKNAINQMGEKYGEVVLVTCGGSNLFAMQYDVLARKGAEVIDIAQHRTRELTS